ncbi:radical SAM family heme chaperone HemW [Tabrizicola oligotrophica]|uniref:Heme chaperone HemW n=1 Tax=Tabrizicola oligotrophica TaxID=2710650 RepID=A0A6M0QTH0_9RHOB|nr:radical SAM family heme chaperone HemW [Tabrizicola oligotrophica]NEY90301.1 coproporphyrinogen III oxidase [Tabrizicola oligotrophica]
MYDWRPGGFGLYVHWPFCQAKCPYCDFNSHVSSAVAVSDWRAAYRAEIARYAEETSGRVLQTIYIGGGTPSLMDPDLIADIIQTARANWPMSNDLEVTLEANPSSVEAGRFRDYREAGVNRVSLGVQALDDASLKALGRLHNKLEALTALDIARSTFDRVNFDLIYARQFQTLAAWKDELSEAISMAGDHLSLYQLTIEDGTAFAERERRGRLPGLPDEALSADMFDLTQDMTSAAGLPPYEVSNHAKAGAESRHNMIYWRGGDYIGVGPGAHGRITTERARFATESHRSPAVWLERALKLGSGESSRATLDPDEMGTEYLLMSLRTKEGLDLRRYEVMRGKGLPEGKMRDLIALGLVWTSDGHVGTTAAGRPLLNAVLRDLCD